MIWYEVIEDLGDGSVAARRFRTMEAAKAFVELEEEWCFEGAREVDTDSDFFYFEDDDALRLL